MPFGSFWRINTIFRVQCAISICAYINMLAYSVEVRVNPICRSVPGLLPDQRKMCVSHPDLLGVISAGILNGAEECRRQFRHHRWNCTALGDHTLFKPELKIGTREAAYQSAIKSAAVLQSIVTSCAENKLSECGCDTSRYGEFAASRWRRNANRPSQVNRAQVWMWGGCSAELGYAMEYSRKFLAAGEQKYTERALMNLHNYETGRRVVSNYLRARCKCHGASGSCTTRTCWVVLPQLREVSSILKKKHTRANKVSVIYYDQKATFLYLTNKKKYAKPKKNSLVYLDESPSFCDEDEIVGSTGTTSRKCNATSTKQDNCNTLCCGRGFSVQSFTRQWQCDCEFSWCCRVKCRICQESSGRHICN